MTAPLLNRAELAGPYRITPAQRESLLAEACEQGWLTCSFAPAGPGWIAELGQALGFPDYFGANFDALYDCLCDSAILPQAGCVLVFSNTEVLSEEERDILIAVLQAASDEWRSSGRLLWALFDARRIDLDPFPGAPRPA